MSAAKNSSPQSSYRQRLRERDETKTFVKELIQTFASDNRAREREKSLDLSEKLSAHVVDLTEEVDARLKSTQERLNKVDAGMCSEYSAVMGDANPDKDALRQEVAGVQRELRRAEREADRLEGEKRRVDNHRKHRKLQARVAPVHFDLSSSDTQVKGYITKPDGDLQTFAFDYKEDCPCYVSDYMWDSI